MPAEFSIFKIYSVPSSWSGQEKKEEEKEKTKESNMYLASWAGREILPIWREYENSTGETGLLSR